MSNNVISTENLVKTFGKTKALDGVNLAVEPGEVYGFIGPNGAGKSTTIRVLLGVLKPDSGSAKIFGRDAWNDAVDIHKGLLTFPAT